MTRTFDIDRHDAMTASWSLNTQTRHQIAWRRVVDRMQVTLLVRVPVENEANLPLFIFCCSRSFVKTVCAAFKSFSFSTHIIEGIYNDIYNSLKTECRQIFINQKKQSTFLTSTLVKNIATSWPRPLLVGQIQIVVEVTWHVDTTKRRVENERMEDWVEIWNPCPNYRTVY